jgi:hypothetical protein
MESKPRLELATLPTRHSDFGQEVLKRFGTAAVLRLSLDPVLVPPLQKQRAITVDWVSRDKPDVRVEEVREVGWSDLVDATEADCIRLRSVYNEEQITECAAIAVMALLIHELERLTVKGALEIGSGADYLGTMEGKGGDLPIEVSGIRADTTGRQSSGRLGRKCQQLLKKNAAGFVSLTTFRRLKAGILHSYLHYVERRGSGKRGGRKGRGKGRKRQ